MNTIRKSSMCCGSNIVVSVDVCFMGNICCARYACDARVACVGDIRLALIFKTSEGVTLIFEFFQCILDTCHTCTLLFSPPPPLPTPLTRAWHNLWTSPCMHIISMFYMWFRKMWPPLPTPFSRFWVWYLLISSYSLVDGIYAVTSVCICIRAYSAIILKIRSFVQTKNDLKLDLFVTSISMENIACSTALVHFIFRAPKTMIYISVSCLHSGACWKISQNQTHRAPKNALILYNKRDRNDQKACNGTSEYRIYQIAGLLERIQHTLCEVMIECWLMAHAAQVKVFIDSCCIEIVSAPLYIFVWKIDICLWSLK